MEKKERIYIAKLRANLAFFGHDTSDMTDEEFVRIINSYKSEKRNIDNDVKNSRQYREKFEDEII